MALLFFDGFSNGGSIAKPEWASGGVSVAPGRQATTGALNTGTLTLAPGSAKVTVGFAYKYAPGNGTGVFPSFRSSGVAHPVLVITSTGVLEIRLGTAAGTLLATTTAPAFPANEWHNIQVAVTVADAGGTVEVKVDGVTVINFTGDTRNAGTTTTIDSIAFAGAPGNGGQNTIVADLWVTDETDGTATQGRPNTGFLGDLKVSALVPSGNGASSQFVGSDGNSVDNYLLVDEPAAANTTDYVGSPTVGNRDLYVLPDLPSNAGAVYGLRQFCYVARSDAGVLNGKLLLRDGAGTVVDDWVISPTPGASGSFGARTAPARYTKPAGLGGGVWSPAAVNALQAGIEVTA